MNNVLIVADSLESIEETLNTLDERIDYRFPIWIIVTVLLIVIVYYIYKQNKSYSRNVTLNKEVDFDNIINSAFNSEELYNKLKKECHPDRFISDDRLNSIACELFQEITKNKGDLKRLEILKMRAMEKLKINIK